MAQRITIISGAYGSGKTEFALAYAAFLQKKATIKKITILDLDIVNPYFRSRDLQAKLQRQGIEVLSSAPGMEEADIPALNSGMFSVLRDASQQLVLDVGGSDAGARVLGRFANILKGREYDFWLVINPFRPDTINPEKTKELFQKIQEVSRLQPTGLVSNINLGSETTLDLWQAGAAQVLSLQKKIDLPLIYHALARDFYLQNQAFFEEMPILSMDLQLRLPWRS